MKNKIGFGVLGLGHIGQKHCLHIIENPNAILVETADLNQNVHFQQYQNVQSIQALVKNPDIDVINVCTPNGFHAEHAILALKAQKHVVIEKPIALSSHECKLIHQASLENNKFVFCVMQNRFSPPSLWIKSVIDQNLLGEIFSIQINCFWNRDDRYYTPNHWHGNLKLDGGPLFTQFSHFIDLLYWLFGDIQITHANFQNFNHQHSTQFEDSGVVSFNLKNSNTLGSINYSTSVYDKNFESSISIIGQNGSVKLGGQYMNEISYCHIKDYTLPEIASSNPPNHYGNYIGSAANHPYVIQNVINTLQQIETPHTQFSEGAAVVQIIENIYKFRNI
jgi:predicted dehydrogenase